MKEDLLKFIQEETYSEDHEDIGAEAIADHAYETKFEAFRYGYNQALKKLEEFLTKENIA